MKSDYDKIERLELDKKQEKVFEGYANAAPWDASLMIIAGVFFIALFIIGGVAERSLNYWMPEHKVPTSGVVVSEPAPTVTEAVPAYPEVYVQKSADPSQAPSPLPPGPVQPEIQKQPVIHP
jgi:hypothetical protein